MALLAGFVGVRLTRRLGQVSYSGYLMHVPLIPLAVWLVGRSPVVLPPAAVFVVALPVTFGLPAVAATAGYYLVEEPGRRLGKRLLARWERAAAPPPSARRPCRSPSRCGRVRRRPALRL